MFKELSSVAKIKLLLFTSPSHFLSRCILKANKKTEIELLLIPPSFTNNLCSFMILELIKNDNVPISLRINF